MISYNAFAITSANTFIKNQSTANYEYDGKIYEINSNLVITRVNPVYSFQITPDGTEASPAHITRVSAGAPVSFPYVLKNTGNVTDSYRLDLPFLNGSPEPHLRYIYLDINQNGTLDSGEKNNILQTPSIPAGDSIAMLVCFNVSSSAGDGDSFYLDLQGTSAGDPSVTDTENVNKTVVTDDAVLHLDKSVSVTSVYPGDSFSYLLTIINSGNRSTIIPGYAQIIDGSVRNGVLVTDSIPNETEYKAGSLYGIPNTGRRIFSIDNGTTWIEAATQLAEPTVETITDLGYFLDGSILSGQQIKVGFDVKLDDSPSGTPITNKGRLDYRNLSGNQYDEATNEVKIKVLTSRAAKVYIGPKDRPETTHQFKATIQHPATTIVWDDLGDTGSNNTDETVHGGVPVVAPNPFGTVVSGSFISFHNTVRNASTFTDTLNIRKNATSNLPADWLVLFYKDDGITSLVDTNGDGLPDSGPLLSGESYTFVTKIKIPKNAAEGDNGGVGFRTIVEARSADNPTIANLTINTIPRIMSLGNFWDPFEKSEDAPDVVTQGTVIPYTNTFGNYGPGVVYNTLIWDELPAYLENPHAITGLVSATIWNEVAAEKLAMNYARVRQLMNIHGTNVTDDKGTANIVKVISRVNPFNGDVEWYMFEIPNQFEGQIHFKAVIAPLTPDGQEIINTFHLTSDTTALATTNKVNNVVAVSGVLSITKEVNKESATVGDPLLYTVEVENIGDPGEDLTSVVLTDKLPEGFRYLENTARMDELKTEPAISEDGQTLTWNIGNLNVGDKHIFKYALLVTSGSNIGDNKNIARASALFPLGSPAWTEAVAVVEVEEGIFTDKSIIIGKVYVDQNDNRVHDVAEPCLEGIRIYLEDGTFSITDQEGKYHFTGVRKGLHVLRLDETSMPDGYLLKTLNVHNLGKASSELIDLKWGTMKKVNFRVVKNNILSKKAIKEDFGKLTSLKVKRDGALTIIDIIADKEFTHSIHNDSERGTALIDLPGIIESRLPSAQKYRDSNLKKIRIFKDTEGNRIRINLLLRKRTSGYQPISIEEVSPKHIRLKIGQGSKIEPDNDPTKVRSEIPYSDLNPDIPMILEPADGAIFVSQEKINVTVACHMAASFDLVVNNEIVNKKYIGTKSYDVKKRQALYKYISVSLDKGKNILQFKIILPGKKEAISKTITVLRSDTAEKLLIKTIPEKLIADGLTEPVVEISLVDENDVPTGNGTVITLEIEKGQILSDDFRPTEPGHQAKIKDGKAIIRLPASASAEKRKLFIFSGETEYEAELIFHPHLRNWILTGYADGRISHLKTKKISEESTDTAEKYDGELGLFMKGKLPGDLLLTTSYNSDHDDEDGDILQTEDPLKYYPVYGDESEQGYEAESRDNLFVKIEKDQSYIMYGDYETQLDESKLAAYNRSFTGGKLHLETTYIDTDAFISYNDQALVKEELQGEGISGYYYLQENILENSEKITLEIRDRNHPDVILEEQQMSRYTDYNIDYDAGRILFKRPVHSQDEDHNPIFIVAEYEVDSAKNKEYYTYGGRVSVHDSEKKYELGFSHITEEGDPTHHIIKGIDATIKILPELTLTAEYAQSDSFENGKDDAYLIELESEQENMNFSLYTREIGSKFDNISMSGYTEGIKETGITGAFKLTETFSIENEIYTRSEDDPDTKRDVFINDFLYSGKRWELRLGVGYIREKEKNEDGMTEKSESPFIRIGTEIDITEKISVQAIHQQALSDSNTEEPTYTEIDLAYQLSEKTRAYIGAEQRRQEDSGDEINLVLGTESEINDTFSAYERFNIDGGSSGKRTYSSTGLEMDHAISVELNLTGSAEISHTLSKTDEEDQDFWSLTLGFDYHPLDSEYTLLGRYEVKVEDLSKQHLLELGGTTKVNENTTFFARDIVTYIEDDANSDEWTVELLMGLAYRPVFYDKWNIITDIEIDFEKGNETADSDELYGIKYSLEAHYQYDPMTLLEMKYACKYVEADYAGGGYFTDLKAFTLHRDLTKRYFCSFGARLLTDYEVNTYSLGYGAEVGARLKKDFKIALGYNFTGFHDDDFSRGSHWEKGPYLSLTWKFDESLFGILKRLRGKKGE